MPVTRVAVQVGIKKEGKSASLKAHRYAVTLCRVCIVLSNVLISTWCAMIAMPKP